MIHTSDEGTSYCSQCEDYAKRIKDLEMVWRAAWAVYKEMNERTIERLGSTLAATWMKVSSI